MNWWTVLGSWITLAIAIAALLFSVCCFSMIRTILRHVLKFDPDYQRQIEEMHDEVVVDDCEAL